MQSNSAGEERPLIGDVSGAATKQAITEAIFMVDVRWQHRMPNKPWFLKNGVFVKRIWLSHPWPGREQVT